jgi:hypothetical protein
MARKRGGIAGFYDRNKGLIQKAVPAALSFIPGAGIPLAAGAGALMRGLDRPGKAGIGFDPFAALKGGVEGAVVGAGTQGARALLTGGGPLAGTVPKIGGGGAKGAAKLTADGIPRMPLGLTGNEPAQSMKFTQALLQPQVLSGAVQGGLSMLPDAKSAAMEEQTKLGQGQLDLQRAQFEEEKRRADMEQERKRRIAELLMPYIQQQYGSYFGGR